MMSSTTTNKDVKRPRCIWLWGPTGCGKNLWIFNHFNNGVYSKAFNIWWDGYQGEEVVTFDNMCKGTRFIPTILKWAKGVFPTLKIKYGHVKPNYKWFFITSVYSMDECLKNSKYLNEMKEVFEVVHYNDVDSLLNK